MAASGFIEPPPGLFGPGAGTSAPDRREPQPAAPALAPAAAAPAAVAPTTAPSPHAPAVQARSVAQAAPAAPHAALPHEATSPASGRGGSGADAAAPLAYDAARGELPPFPRFDEAALPAPAGGEPAGPAGQSAPAQPAWRLHLPDGAEFGVDAPVVLGRNPSAEQFPHVAVRALHDPTRTMSKTHARFVVEHGALLVDDLNSTNGVALLPGGELARAVPVEPGRPVEVRAGDVVQLGEFPIVVVRS